MFLIQFHETITPKDGNIVKTQYWLSESHHARKSVSSKVLSVKVHNPQQQYKMGKTK